MTLEQTETAQRYLRPYATRIIIDPPPNPCTSWIIKAWLDGGAVRTFRSLYAVKEFCKRRQRRLASEVAAEKKG